MTHLQVDIPPCLTEHGVLDQHLQRPHNGHPPKFIWFKGNLVHFSHLDFVRGRQATVAMRVSELFLGIRRYRSEMRLRT